jgi:hypothetical protein
VFRAVQPPEFVVMIMVIRQVMCDYWVYHATLSQSAFIYGVSVVSVVHAVQQPEFVVTITATRQVTRFYWGYHGTPLQSA